MIRCIVEEEQARGGIIIPDTAKEKPQQGEVIAVGDGKVLESGSRVPLDVKRGNRVLFGKYAGTDVVIGGVAVIRVGAATEIELKEKKARVEDAMHATKAAVDEGIVPGGVAFLRSQAAVEALTFNEEDQETGAEIVRRALEEPLRMIAQNAGVEGAVIVEKVKADKNPNFGFNAETEQYEDLFKSGVIDPVKVTRTALQNAASIAGLLLTTEAVVSELPKKKAASPAPEMEY